jgi:predicted amino acid racemase
VYLDVTARRNPALIHAAARLHQDGTIPANTYVIDLDAIAANAAAMAREADRVGLSLYLMTKHFNRNPIVVRTALEAGIGSTVCVDVQCAMSLARFGLPVGHVGHLVQIPKHNLPGVLRMQPEVATVYAVEQAQQISDAAVAAGRVQDVILRVRGRDDIIYPNEEGGIWEDELDAACARIGAMAGVRIAGVVTFPGTLYNPASRAIETTVNFETLHRAAERLRALGHDVRQLNAPGSSSTRGFEVVARAGGTHAEPGHALTGTTPLHLDDDDAPERPAMVYVNEVSHQFEGRSYVYGGGFYACDTPATRGDDSAYHTRAWECRAFVGRDPDAILDTRVPVDIGSFFGRTRNATDYYGGTLVPDEPADIRVGDSVVYGFRAQVFTTRAQVAVVSGVQSSPRLVGLFDRSNNLLDEDWFPRADTVEAVRALAGAATA